MMFNDKYGLTSAVLSGDKTMTRRIVNPQPYLNKNVGFVWKDKAYGIGFSKKLTFNNFIRCANTPYKLEEITAIAQAYKNCDLTNFDEEQKQTDWYKAGFNNKMFVKPELMPHQLKITGISIERLQDISDEDCLKEGIREIKHGNDNSYIVNGEKYSITSYSPKLAYADLIDKISGKGTWEKNPWVWVFEFELVK